MLTAIEIDGGAIPCAVKVSGAYAARMITTREYSSGLRVALLEDSVKRPFYVAAWSQVMVGDIVLMPFHWPNRKEVKIAKVRIEGLVMDPGANGELLVIVRFVFDGLHFGQAFNSDDVAYVQSRL